MMFSTPRTLSKVLVSLLVCLPLVYGQPSMAVTPMCSVTSPSLDDLLNQMTALQTMINANPNCTKGSSTDSSDSLNKMIASLAALKASNTSLNSSTLLGVTTGLSELSLRLEEVIRNSDCTQAQKMGFFEGFIRTLHAFTPFMMASANPYALQVQLVTTLITTLYNFYLSLKPDMSDTKIQALFLKGYCSYDQLYPLAIDLLNVPKTLSSKKEELRQWQSRENKLWSASAGQEPDYAEKIKELKSNFLLVYSGLSGVTGAEGLYCRMGLSAVDTSSPFSTSEMNRSIDSLVTELQKKMESGFEDPTLNVRISRSNSMKSYVHDLEIELKGYSKNSQAMCQKKSEAINKKLTEWELTLGQQLDLALELVGYLGSHTPTSRAEIRNRIHKLEEEISNLEKMDQNPSEQGLILQVLANINFLLFGNGDYQSDALTTMANGARAMIGFNRVSYAEAWLDYQIDKNLGTTFNRYDGYMDEFKEAHGSLRCQYLGALEGLWSVATLTRDSIDSFCVAYQKVNRNFLINLDLEHKCTQTLHDWKEAMEERLETNREFNRLAAELRRSSLCPK